MESELLNKAGYEMLIRVDERVDYLCREVEVNTMKVDNLNCWKNKTIGALSIVGALTGYGLIF